MCKYTKIMAEYKSKTVVVDRPQMSLFNAFTNLEAMVAAVPADKRGDVVVEGDTTKASYAGFTIAVCIAEKIPFSKIVFKDVEAPFHFSLTIHLDPAQFLNQTSLTIVAAAELNFMMKTLIGPKIQEALDQIVLSIANGGLIQQ